MGIKNNMDMATYLSWQNTLYMNTSYFMHQTNVNQSELMHRYLMNNEHWLNVTINIKFKVIPRLSMKANETGSQDAAYVWSAIAWSRQL